MLKSPLNYTGSKTELIEQLTNYFPEKNSVNNFIDLFCGGLSVTINTDYNSYISNDIITPLINLYKEMYEYSLNNNYEDFKSNILSKKINKDNPSEYSTLRNSFNNSNDPYEFFSLVSSCTNNMMRFNKSMKFNQTFGKRTISDKTLEKIEDYFNVLKNKKIEFTNYHFKEFFDKVEINKNDFIYLDPPYSSSKTDDGQIFKVEAGYNAIWSNKDELIMYDLLDNLNSNGNKFAMSNLLYHNDVKNPFYNIFKKWNVIELDFNYEKVARNKGKNSVEILVTNY